MNIRQLTNQEFNNFTNNFYLKSIYQTTNYAFVMQKQGYDCMYLGLVNDGVVLAATLVLIKKESGFKYAYAPRGFLINYEDFYLFKDFTQQIKDFLNKSGVIAIKINPMIVRRVYDLGARTITKNDKYDLIFESLQHNNYYHLGYNNFFEALKPRFEAIIDLNKSVPELFKQIKKSYRTKIRGSIKNGMEIYRGHEDEIEFLYNFTKKKYPRNIEYLKDCYNYFNKDNMIDFYYTKLNTKTYLKTIQDKLNHYETMSNDLNMKIIEQFKKNPKHLIDKKINIDKYLFKYKNELIEATKLLRLYPDGIITAAMMVVRQGTTATILIDGYDPSYSRFNAKHLLIWELIQSYQKQGFTRLNMGGVSNMVVDLDKYTGLNDFKNNFGAQIVEYGGDFELMVNKRNYNLYRNYVPLKNLIKSKLIKDK